MLTPSTIQATVSPVQSTLIAQGVTARRAGKTEDLTGDDQRFSYDCWRDLGRWGQTRRLEDSASRCERHLNGQRPATGRTPSTSMDACSTPELLMLTLGPEGDGAGPIRTPPPSDTPPGAY